MTRKILTFLTAILFASNIFFLPNVSAENSTSVPSFVLNNFEGDESFVKFLNSLPQKKIASYKSRQRPILLEGAMNNGIITPNHYRETAATSQDFVLLVVEKYIKTVNGRR